MKVLRRTGLPVSGGTFFRRIQERAACEEKKSGRKIIVLSEKKLSRSIGRLDSRNPSAFFLYLNIPAIRLSGLTQKYGTEYRDLFMEEYVLAYVRLAGSVYEERPLSYTEGLAACFLAVRQEEKGCIDLLLPGIPRMLLYDKNRDWQTDRLYCELQAMEAVLHSIYDGDDFAEAAMDSSVTLQSPLAGSARATGNNINNIPEENLTLIRQRDLLAALADMPEIIYDRKGMPHLAVCRLLDLQQDLQRRPPDSPDHPDPAERFPVFRTLRRFRQIPEDKYPDMGSKADSFEYPDMASTADAFEKGLTARLLCLNNSASGKSDTGRSDSGKSGIEKSDTRDDTAASTTETITDTIAEAIAEYETRAGIFIKRSKDYKYRAFRDNRIAIARTLIGADAVMTDLPTGISGGKVHPLGYW